MQTDQKQFSLFERFSVVAIILIIFVMAIHDVLHSTKASEERTLNNAAVDYARVKSMYVEQRQTVSPSMARENRPGAINSHNAPIH